MISGDFRNVFKDIVQLYKRKGLNDKIFKYICIEDSNNRLQSVFGLLIRTELQSDVENILRNAMVSSLNNNNNNQINTNMQKVIDFNKIKREVSVKLQKYQQKQVDSPQRLQKQQQTQQQQPSMSYEKDLPERLQSEYIPINKLQEMQSNRAFQSSQPPPFILPPNNPFNRFQQQINQQQPPQQQQIFQSQPSQPPIQPPLQPLQPLQPPQQPPQQIQSLQPQHSLELKQQQQQQQQIFQSQQSQQPIQPPSQQPIQSLQPPQQYPLQPPQPPPPPQQQQHSLELEQLLQQQQQKKQQHQQQSQQPQQHPLQLEQLIMQEQQILQQQQQQQQQILHEQQLQFNQKVDEQIQQLQQINQQIEQQQQPLQSSSFSSQNYPTTPNVQPPPFVQPPKPQQLFHLASGKTRPVYRNPFLQPNMVMNSHTEKPVIQNIPIHKINPPRPLTSTPYKRLIISKTINPSSPIRTKPPVKPLELSPIRSTNNISDKSLEEEESQSQPQQSQTLPQLQPLKLLLQPQQQIPSPHSFSARNLYHSKSPLNLNNKISINNTEKDIQVTTSPKAVIHKQLENDKKCRICLTTSTDKMLIHCTSCNIYVHELCYSFTKLLPTETKEVDGICERCMLLSAKPDTPKQCILCNLDIEGEAYRQTSDNLLVHSVCLIELLLRHRELDIEYSSSILTKAAENEVNNHICSICKNKCGWCIKCDMESCTAYFHPCCILNEYRLNGLVLDENESYCCIRHITGKMKRKRESDEDNYDNNNNGDDDDKDNDSKNVMKRIKIKN